MNGEYSINLAKYSKDSKLLDILNLLEHMIIYGNFMRILKRDGEKDRIY